MKESTAMIIEPMQNDFVLGNWVVVPELNYLYEKGAPGNRRALEPRLMQLLCFLAAHEGQVLSRNQLNQELWPTVIVNENSLTRAVSELRKKLKTGKYSDNCYLETIPKKGYRLKPGFIRKSDIDAQKNPPKQEYLGDSIGLIPLKYWQSAVTAASLLLVVALLSSQFIMSADQPVENSESAVIADQVIDQEETFGVTPISLNESFDGNKGFSPLVGHIPSVAPPLVSKDGKTLAYIRYENDISTIFLSSLDSVETPLAVFSSERKLYNLSWSPLGDALLFASQPMAVATTLMAQNDNKADLLMLDLVTLEIKVLIDRDPERPAINHSREIKLT